MFYRFLTTSFLPFAPLLHYFTHPPSHPHITSLLRQRKGRAKQIPVVTSQIEVVTWRIIFKPVLWMYALKRVLNMVLHFLGPIVTPEACYISFKKTYIAIQDLAMILKW